MLRQIQTSCDYCEYGLLGFHDRTAHMEAGEPYACKDTVIEIYRRIVFFHTVDGPKETAEMYDSFRDNGVRTNNKSVGGKFSRDPFVVKCNETRPYVWRHKLWIGSVTVEDAVAEEA